MTIDEPEGLRPGMVVTILVGQRGRAGAAADDGHPAGRTAEDDSPSTRSSTRTASKVARKRRVKLDGVYDNRIRLVEGERAARSGTGDVIVVTGAFRLTDGQAVRVLEVPEPVNVRI